MVEAFVQGLHHLIEVAWIDDAWVEEEGSGGSPDRGGL